MDGRETDAWELVSAALSGSRALGWCGAVRRFAAHRAQVDIEQAVIRLWTEDDGAGNDKAPVFAELNRVLVDDRADELAMWMVFVRIVTSYIQAHPLPRHCKVWRGSQLSGVQAATLRVGDVLRPPMFVATSLHRTAAERFLSDQRRYLICFSISAGSPNASAIQASHTNFAYEGEVLLSPYTPIAITDITTPKKKKKGGARGPTVISAEVLDGLQYQQTVELPQGQHARVFPI